MLVGSVVSSSLALTLLSAFASPAPLLFGGHHGPPPKVGGDGGHVGGGGGGSGSGGSTQPPPSGPSSGGDTTPAPGAATGGGHAAPKGPSSGAPTPPPKGPRTALPSGGKATPAPPPVGARAPSGPGATTGGDDAVLDPSWNIWWYFHEDEFLKYAEGPQTAEAAPLAGQRSAGPVLDPIARSIAALIEHERSTEILTGALLGIAHVQGEIALDAIHGSLGSTTNRVREVSLLALGAAGDESRLSLLESLLRDDDQGRKLSGERGQSTPQRLRAHAAYALALLGERTSAGRTRQLAARALSDVLAHDKSAGADLQVACVLGLGLVPLASAPDAPHEIDDPTPWLSRERMTQFLVGMLADRERPDALRSQIPGVLARLAAQGDARARGEAAQAIVTQLQRGTAVSSGLREGCINALGELGQPTHGEIDLRIQTALLQAAERGPEAERCFAWMALSTLAAHEGDGETAATSERAELRKHMVQGLGEVHSRERSWIALALGVLENRRARAGDREPSADVRAALRAAFAHATGPEEESGIAMGIGLSGDLEGALLVGQRLVRVAQADVVGYEVLSIGLAHDASQRELVRKMLSTSIEPAVVEHSAEALGLIGDPDLTKTLVAGAQANACLEARESHVLALADVGDRTALEMLCKKLGDVNQPPCMRAALSMALGGICSHGVRKWYTGLRTLANWRVPSPTLISDGQGVLEIG